MSGPYESIGCEQCPNCGSKNCKTWEDYRPFSYTEYQCADCGFTVWPKIYFCDLERLNKRRTEVLYEDENGNELELEPLEKMPKTDYGHDWKIE